MSTKRSALNVAALRTVAGPQADPVEKLERPKARFGAQQRSRIGKVPIQGYYPEETRDRLKVLSIRTKKTVEELLGEGIEHVLQKYDG